MNILINCSNLRVGGGIQVSHSFINGLKNYSQHTYVVIFSNPIASLIEVKSFGDNFKFYKYEIVPSLRKRNEFLDKIVRVNKIDCVFTIFGPSYWKPNVFHISGYAKPHYIYKDSPFFKEISLMSKIKLKVKEFIHLKRFNQANILIAENSDVSERLKKIFPQKNIYTVTNYYHQIFDNQDAWDKSISLSLFEGVTLLTISANYPHKNLKIIPQVIKELKKTKPDFNFRFVLTMNRKNFIKNIDDNIEKHIVFIGKVNINQCPNLYTQSSFMFLPTLLECYSACYPEAMRMNKPILTSDLNFAKSICGEAAYYFNPLSPKDIANAIIYLTENENIKDHLINNGKEQLKKFDNYIDRTKKYLKIIQDETNNSRP